MSHTTITELAPSRPTSGSPRPRPLVIRSALIPIVGLAVLLMTVRVATPQATTPEISLNRTVLNFGADTSGTITGAQRILILNTGTGTLSWTAVGDQVWINVTPASGINSEYIDVTVNPTGLGAGTYTGQVAVSDSAASNSPQTVDVSLVVHSASTAPFGAFDTPVDGSTVGSMVPVTGWSLDDIGVQNLRIYRDPVPGEGVSLIYIGDAVFIDGARPDVEALYPGHPNNYRAGWSYNLRTWGLPNQGNGTYILHATAVDLEGNQVSLGSKTIICDNANAVRPFGAIDNPAPGGEASGSSYVVRGWALTPQPNTIPTDGSTIDIYLDGVNLGNPTYNIFRADVAALFPGFSNSNGPGWQFTVDTTVYVNGVHTISVTAEDDAGNVDSIASHSFTIYNPGSPVAVELLAFTVE